MHTSPNNGNRAKDSNPNPLSMFSDNFRPIKAAKSEVQQVTRSKVGRLERDLLSESKIHGRLPGWHNNEIPHTCDLIWHGSSLHPFDHIFDEMLTKAPDLASFVNRMVSAIIALPREIVPGDKSDGAREAVELVKQQIRILEGEGDRSSEFGGNNWVQGLTAMLENIWAGISFVEVNWNPDTMFADELIQRPMHAFGFVETDSGGNRLRMRRPGGLIDIPPGKIIMSRNSLKGYPWGDPVAKYVHLMWRQLIYNSLDWSLYLELWAKPIPDVEYELPKQTGRKDEAATPGQEVDEIEQKCVDLAAHLYGNGYSVHSDNVKVKLLNTNSSGGEQYLQAANHFVKAIARALINEVTTPGLQDFGSLKMAEITSDMSKDRLHFFAPNLGSVMSGTLFRWLPQIHLPGLPASAHPRLRISALNQQSWDRLFKGITSAFETGAVEVPEGHAREVWGIRESNPGEEMVRVSTGSSSGNDGNNSGGGGASDINNDPVENPNPQN